MKTFRRLGTWLFLGAVACSFGAQLAAYAGHDKKENPKKSRPGKGGSERRTFKAFDGSSGPFFQQVDTSSYTRLRYDLAPDREVMLKSTTFLKVTPRSRDKHGNYVVQQEIVAVRMTLEIHNDTFSFDSFVKKQTEGPLTSVCKALLKQKLTFVISPDWKLLKTEGREELVKRMSEANPEIKTGLETFMSRDALTHLDLSLAWLTPPRAINRGDSWTKKSKADLGLLGKCETTYKFTLDSQDHAKREKIKIEADLKYKLPTKDSNGQPFPIKSAKLLNTNNTGEVLIDRDAGRIDSSTFTWRAEWLLTIENAPLEFWLDREETTTTRTAGRLEHLIKK